MSKLSLIALPLVLMLAAAGCSSGGTGCSRDDQCPIGELCNLQTGNCYDPNADGDSTPDGDPDGDVQPDGDVEPDVDYGCIPLIQLTPPDVVNYGAVQLGSDMTKQLYVCNIGCSDLLVSYLDYPNRAELSEFRYLNYDPDTGLPHTIAPGDCWELSITYSPINDGGDDVEVMVVSNDPLNPLRKVHLRSEYKGSALIDVQPQTVVFDNVNLGELIPPVEVTVTHVGDLDGNKLLNVTGVVLQRVDGNFAVGPAEGQPGLPTYNNPVMLRPGETYRFNVLYTPTGITIPPEVHSNAVWIPNLSDLAEQQVVELGVTGTANSSSVVVIPTPIDFGTVYINDFKLMDGQIINYGAQPFTLPIFDLPPAMCSPGADLEMRLQDGNGCEGRTLQPGENCPFQMMYSPTDTVSDECKLRLRYSPAADPNLTFPLDTPVRGGGRTPNVPPVCRAAFEPHGADIQRVIEAAIGEELYFYGHISTDSDSNSTFCEWKWELRQKPANSRAAIEPITPQGNDIRLTVDKGGMYKLQLQAKDCDGSWCNTPKEVTVKVQDNQSICVRMEWSGDGLCNVNLGWKAGMGFLCDETTMTAQRTCIFPLGYGSAVVSQFSTAAMNGRVEEICHPNPIDGNYAIRVTYAEDCQCESIGQFGCWTITCWDGEDSTDVTVKVFVNQETTPSWTLRTGLDSQGDSDEWQMTREYGVFQAPVHAR